FCSVLACHSRDDSNTRRGRQEDLLCHAPCETAFPHPSSGRSTIASMEIAILRSESSDPQHFEDAVAHWDHPSTFRSLAVRHKNDSVIPVKVLDTSPVKLSPVSHPSVPCEDNDVPKQVEVAGAPVAGCGRHQQLSFGFAIQSEPAPMLHPQLELRNPSDEIPFFRFV